jgi:hypothetical protein
MTRTARPYFRTSGNVRPPVLDVDLRHSIHLPASMFHNRVNAQETDSADSDAIFDDEQDKYEDAREFLSDDDEDDNTNTEV